VATTWKLDDVPAPIIVYDENGRATGANQAAQLLFGLTAEDLVGVRADDMNWLVIEAKNEPITVHPVLAALKSRRPIRAVLMRARRPDGTDVWIQVDATPELSGSGEVSRVVAAVTDVTYLLSHSRATSRSVGDHIVDEVTDTLAEARMEPHSILATVTKALTRLRPGIWVASLMGKDPAKMAIVVSDETERSDVSVDFASSYLDAMRMSGNLNTAPISTRVIESGQPLLIPNISVGEIMGYLNEEVRGYLDDHPWLSPDVRLGVIVVPMRARGAIIGTLGLFERRTSNPLTDKDTLWLQAIADRTGLAVENAQLYEVAVKRLERLSALQSVSLAVSASPDLTLTLKVILDHVSAQLKVDAADVLLLDDSDNTLTLGASTGFLATAVLDYRLPVDEGLPGRAVTSRRIETVTALSAFSQFRRRSLFAREGFKSYGAVPLITRGKLLGAIEIFHRSTLSPDPEWLAFLDALGSVAAVAIDNATMQERLRRAPRSNAPRIPAKPVPDMSRTELEVMRLAVEGLTNRDIAAQVHLSQNTIKFHMRQILQKTGAANRTELAHQAAKEGWL
jgi:PAS domain S-box-containing protein